MRRVGIWGTGITAKLVYQKIDQYDADTEIVCFCDVNPDKINTTFLNLPVYSPEKMVSVLYNNRDIDAIVLGTGVMHHEDIYYELESMLGEPCQDLLYIPDSIIEKQTIEDIPQGGILQAYDANMNKSTLEYLEYEATGACNLNCRGCGHFSNIVEGALSEYDVTVLDRDLHRLSELFEHIRVIHILGGEPLLCQNLDKMIRLTRTYFQDSIIRVVTNGLLVPRMSEKLIAALVENNVNLWISTYEPTLKMYDMIRKFCMEHGIGIVGDVSRIEFSKRINLKGNSTGTTTFAQCNWHQCPNLKDGKLYTCSYAAFAYRLQRKYDLNIPIEEGINLFDQNITGEKIKEILPQPIEFCRYCTIPVMVPWSNDCKKACLADWVVESP